MRAKLNRYADMSRRAALSAAALASMALMAGCSGNAGGAAEGDMAMGAAEGAKVTVVEYASVTCVHCAAWHTNTWPAFKAKYVDTNQVRFVLRELPTPPADIATAGFMIARCAGDDKYFDVVHHLMDTQGELFSGAAQPRDWLLRTANAVGMTEEQFQTCLADQEGVAAMERRIQVARDQGVTGTPAFYVNGKVVQSTSGEGASLDDLSAAIDPLLAG